MFSKLSLGIIFVAVLILAGFWFIQKQSDKNATENLLSANKKAIVADIKIKKSKQLNKQGVRGKKSKKKKLDRMLTPDELYEQQFTSSQAEFELEPTIPDLEVMPEELKRVEEEYANSSESSETFDIDSLSDNPGQISGIFQEDELLPSDNYKEVISIELEQEESDFDDIMEN